MNSFALAKPRNFDEASALVGGKVYKLPILKAGGMDVIDLIKEGIEEPDLLIQLKGLSRDGAIGVSEEGMTKRITIEANTTLAQIAASEIIRERAPVVAQAAESAATPQVRNVATAAGNLLQRPRCWYYRNSEFDCLKKGGDRCFAVEGENQYHAIFGGGPCHIVHPSNLAPALAVCNAKAHLTGSNRSSIAISELFHMPDKGVFDEHILRPGEVITHITLERRPRSGFYAIKAKRSFDWPIVLACVSLELDGPVITQARVWAGAVAPVPWRLERVENALRGIDVRDARKLEVAALTSVEDAEPMSHNSYKLKLLPVAVRRAVMRAGGIWAEGDE